MLLIDFVGKLEREVNRGYGFKDSPFGFIILYVN